MFLFLCSFLSSSPLRTTFSSDFHWVALSNIHLVPIFFGMEYLDVPVAREVVDPCSTPCLSTFLHIYNCTYFSTKLFTNQAYLRYLHSVNLFNLQITYNILTTSLTTYCMILAYRSSTFLITRLFLLTYYIYQPVLLSTVWHTYLLVYETNLLTKPPLTNQLTKISANQPTFKQPILPTKQPTPVNQRTYQPTSLLSSLAPTEATQRLNQPTN